MSALDELPLSPPKRYPTTVHDVAEVLLTGTADLRVWSDWLAPLDVLPEERDGRAVLRLVGCETTYMGIRFRELSLTVGVPATAGNSTRDAVAMVTARTSVRFFAFVERHWFGTPYEHADLILDISSEPHLRTVGRADLVAEAGTTTLPWEAGEETWEGPVLLPRRHPGDRRRWMFAKLTGPSRRRDFDPAADRFQVDAGGQFAALTESDFRPLEWQVRKGGVHSRSKTYAERR